MINTALVITSIANDHHPVLLQYAHEARLHSVPFIVIGDTKSPSTFNLPGCDFYSIARQESLGLTITQKLPKKHYARKNIGYLVAARQGAEVIIETDDDNIPLPSFWEHRSRGQNSHLLHDTGWTNTYKYFTDVHIWPRGFALEEILKVVPSLPKNLESVSSPIQQGLADDNPDVDALYRLTLTLPIVFNKASHIALAQNAICPFNSQNTTWFKEAFPLLYLPSYCSFRMTDIWRSFVAQRIAWSCGWPILFHQSTVRQERNAHNLMNDFKDEIVGYTNNFQLMDALINLKLVDGVDNIAQNMVTCYRALIQMGLIDNLEMPLLLAWLHDLNQN